MFLGTSTWTFQLGSWVHFWSESPGYQHSHSFSSRCCVDSQHASRIWGKPDWEVCSRGAANILPLQHVRVSPPPCQSDHPAKHAWWGCHVLSAGCFSLWICFCSATLLSDRGVACGQPTHHSWVPWESWGPGALWWCEIGGGVKHEMTATWDLCKNPVSPTPAWRGDPRWWQRCLIWPGAAF